MLCARSNQLNQHHTHTHTSTAQHTGNYHNIVTGQDAGCVVDGGSSNSGVRSCSINCLNFVVVCTTMRASSSSSGNLSIIKYVLLLLNTKRSINGTKRIGRLRPNARNQRGGRSWCAIVSICECSPRRSRVFNPSCVWLDWIRPEACLHFFFRGP